MQVCTSLQTDSWSRQHPSTQFYTGRMPFLPPNQQCQSTEANDNILYTNMTTKDKQNKYRVPTNPTNKNSSRLKGTFTPVDFFNVATINITKF